MAETKNVFQEQIMRCAALQHFPLYPEGIRELRDTLRKVAQTPERARAIVDEILQQQNDSPTPSELRKAADVVRGREESVPKGCKVCGGLPWVSTDAGAGVERCTCAKGQWLRAKDDERKMSGDAA